MPEDTPMLDVQLRSLGLAAQEEDDDGMLERVAAAVLGRPGPDQRLGRFEIRRRIGQGGMGSVYEAWDPELRRRVAVKRLRREVAIHARRRGILEAEARALAQLADRHVVQVFETGEHDGVLFVVMELVEGESLEVWQTRSPTLPAILDVYVQAGRGLAAAHRAGLVHRDVKPGNVLVRTDGEVRVADFGLARALDREPSLDDVQSADDAGGTGSRTESGTRAYMAPEQLAFGNSDALTDQFSYCVALWEACTGTRPFDDVQLRAMAAAPDRHWPPTLGSRRIVPWLGSIVRRGLSARPADRWPSMAALVEALVQTPTRRRRRGAVVLGVGILAVVAAAVRAGQSSRSCDSSARMEAVWNTSRARAMRDAPTTQAFSASAYAFAGRSFDGYAAQWVSSYTGACHETWRDGTRSEAQYAETTACLDRALVELDRAATLVEEGEPEVLARVADLVDALPEPVTCRDGDVFVEPTTRDLELMAATDRARLLVAAGRPLEALEHLDDLGSGGLDRGAAAAGAWVLRGVALATVARREEAATALQRGQSAALAADAARRGLEASRELVVLYAHGFADLGRAELAEGLLDAWSDRTDATPRDRALGAMARANVADLRGDVDGAVRLLGDAVDAFVSLDEPVAEARARRRLGGVLQGSGRFDEAALAYQTSGEVLVAALGPEHPELGDLEHALGSLALDRGELEAAESHFTRALVLHEAALGPKSVRLASTLAVLAHVALARGDHREAELLAGRAWALQSTLPVGHPDRGSALLVSAGLHLADGDYGPALAEYEQAHRELYATMTAQEQAILDNNLGWLLCRHDRCAEARRHYELAATRGDDQVRRFAQCGLASVELGEGDPAAARDRARRVLAEVMESRSEDDAELIAELRWVLARAITESGGELDEARRSATESIAWYRETGLHPKIAAAIESWIASHPE